jgi:NitT/TauT family transport system substrate-binding protein
MQRWTLRLNTGFSGPQCWLLLAIRRGFVAQAGIDLALEPGSGAYTAAPAMISGGHDLGYGDIHALADCVARGATDAPLGVYATFRASPAAIVVPRDSAIRAPADLAGRVLLGHASDVGLRLFPAFAAATGLDPTGVRVLPAEGSMAAMLDRVAAGQADGIFAYVSTLTAALAAAGRSADDVRFLRYDRLVPDLHGSVLMASRRVIAEQPAALAALVGALDRGLAAALAEPAAAIDAVLSFAPGADAAVERLRWDTTLAVEMAQPEGAPGGYGGIDAVRLARALALQARADGLPPPSVPDVFTDRFLPPPGQRAGAA